MNSCVLLVLVTIVLKTTAQERLNAVTTKQGLDVSLEDDYEDVFKDDTIVEYYATTQSANEGQSGRQIVIDDFDFENWDLVNENQTTLFDDFNQTIINEIKRKNNMTLHFITTPDPRSLTTPRVTLVINEEMYENYQTTPRMSLNTTRKPIDSFTDEDYTDLNSTETMTDPCNYERFLPPVPPVEKSGRRVSDIKCEEQMWEYKIMVEDVKVNRKLCEENMAKKNKPATQVFGGANAKEGDFPHMGAVGWILKNGTRKWMCGSTLISPWFALTAAHCRGAPSVLKLHRKSREPELVRFGSVYLDTEAASTASLLFTQEVIIEKLLVLKEYADYPKRKYNDIGLLKLIDSVNMRPYIKPACLWSGNLGNSWVGNITGWGKTTNSEGSESRVLKYAEVDFVELNTCKIYMNPLKSRHWPMGLLDHQICAGKLQGGIDACRGDSGGPLQIQSPMPAIINSTGIVHHVVGITSFGIQCGYPLLPGVYTNVTSFLCWIEKNVWPEEYNAFCP